MADLLNIALSGLLSHQRSLSTTGHNIANVNTPGYNRQSAVLETRPTEFMGGLYLGTGVDVDTIMRSVNQFVITQLQNDTSVVKEAETLRSQLDQLDLLFSDPNSGLTANLDRFFSAVQSANDDPTSIVAREVVLNEAQALAKRFNTLEFKLSETSRIISQQMDAAAAQVSNLSSQIATLNRAIVEDSGAGLGQQPNDLLDKRDELLRQLSEVVNISTANQTNGAINVFTGSGQSLVTGFQAQTMITRPSAFNPQVSELAIQSGNIITSIKGKVSGGVLGGLLQARDNIIGDAANTLGRIALAVSDTVNTRNALGLNLEGNLGGNVFSDINSATAIARRTFASSANSLPTDQQVDVSIANIGALTTSDYRLTFTSATNYTLTRLSDNASNAAIDPGLTGTIGPLPAALTFDGLSVALDRPSGNFAANDTFLLQPTLSASANIGMVLNRPEELALAGPVRTDSNLNNLGTGVISAGVVTDTSVPLFSTTPGQLAPPLVIQFTSATSYDILDNTNPAAPVPLAPPQTGLTFPPTPANALLPASFGIELEIVGQPQTGDTFTVDFNTNGFQDNRNGLALANIQALQVLDNGLTSIQGGYGRLLQSIGTQTSQARFNETSSQTLLQQTETRRSEISGVSLDEEAAKLIEFEQAYGASAQVISVARTIFDTLLNSVGG